LLDRSLSCSWEEIGKLGAMLRGDIWVNMAAEFLHEKGQTLRWENDRPFGGKIGG